MLAIISLKLAAFAREHQSLSVWRSPEHINSRKIIQPKDRLMPSNFLCLKGKPKLSVLRVRHLIKHDWHMTKAVIYTRFSNKRFYEGNFEVCLSVEKYDQNHSLRTLVNTKLGVNTVIR